MKKRAAAAEPSDGEFENQADSDAKLLMALHRPSLRRYFISQGRVEDCEDLIQEVWARVVESGELANLKDGAFAKAWLQRVAKNLLTDVWRKERTRRLLNVPMPDGNSLLERFFSTTGWDYADLQRGIEVLTQLLALVLDRRNAPHQSLTLLVVSGSKRFERFVSDHWEAKLFALSAHSREEYSEQPGASHQVVELFTTFDHGLAEPVARRVPRFKTYPHLKGMHESETGGTCPRHYHRKQSEAKQVESWCRSLREKILPAARGYLENSRLKSAGAAQ